MENIKLKKNKIGRPKYQPNIEQLKKLYAEIKKGSITNEKACQKANCHKTKWFELKKKYDNLEVLDND